MNVIAKRLQDLRHEHKYSQEYVAYELGMTQGNYCKLEKGQYYPRLETVEKICKIYNLDMLQFIMDIDTEIRGKSMHIDQFRKLAALIKFRD